MCPLCFMSCDPYIHTRSCGLRQRFTIGSYASRGIKIRSLVSSWIENCRQIKARWSEKNNKCILHAWMPTYPLKQPSVCAGSSYRITVPDKQAGSFKKQHYTSQIYPEDGSACLLTDSMILWGKGGRGGGAFIYLILAPWGPAAAWKEAKRKKCTWLPCPSGQFKQPLLRQPRYYITVFLHHPTQPGHSVWNL